MHFEEKILKNKKNKNDNKKETNLFISGPSRVINESRSCDMIIVVVVVLRL